MITVVCDICKGGAANNPLKPQTPFISMVVEQNVSAQNDFRLTQPVLIHLCSIVCLRKWADDKP